MEIIYTLEARVRFNQSIDFLRFQGVPETKIFEIIDAVKERMESLRQMGRRVQTERFMDHLGREHRRIICGHYKIVYYVQDDCIFVTDIFDSRQDPSKMRG